MTTTAKHPTSIALCAPLQIEAASPPVEGQAGASGSAGASGASGGGGTSGGLPRFRMVAYTGGPMRIAGWRFPVVVDLAGLSIPSQNRPIRFGHDASSTGGVGHSDAIRVEANQLVASGVISRDTTVAREVVASSKNGFPWQASIGASVDQVEFVAEGQTALVNGQTFNGPLNIARRATLGEISFVDLGADRNTSASVAASASFSSNQEQPMGEQTTTTQVTQTPATPEQIRASALAETQRIAAIRKVCNISDAAPGAKDRLAEIEAQAIRDGWDATRAELEALRASRPQAPMIMQRGQDTLETGKILEAACFLSQKLESPEKHCSEQILDAASRRFRQGINLTELFLEGAIANGYHGHCFRTDARRVMEFAFGAPHVVQAGLSNIDMAGILSNVANKFLLQGFFSVERTWRNICAVRNVSDFKTVTSYRMIGASQYELVPPGGTIKHGTLGNETYSNKADTYALMLNLDRRDIFNDDLGAITAIPQALGRSSGQKINDIFWSAFIGSGTFFSVGNKNYLTGADTAMSIDGLTRAEVAFLDQVDGDGKPIGVMPSIVLVPTSLSAIGTQLYKSVELRDTTSNTKFPVANPHQGKFRVEVSRYLANAAYAALASGINGAKAWYLLADPADLPTIEVAFLNGNESPTIESTEASFNQLGIQMRGYHDFGVAMQDPRAANRSKGEA